ncbi:glycosyltransferase family 15 protein [Trichocladium antarcticum]|uniref:Glycosyltransferase family 15 protein n=1 Tax=Trichocladium antarcticum TaxID=1450529 RepID=A0AAN6UMY1_9PEZI|nr:glycosyltransferase family 15 protein [Trichocladium antarcticum]
MKLLSALAAASRTLRRPARRFRHVFRGAALIVTLCIAESLLYGHVHSIPRPAEDLDAPFSTQCQDPRVAAAQPRENAVLVMLARNSEKDEARDTIANIEAQFNQWFHYPVLFLNNEPWDPEFVRALNRTVSGPAMFEVIPQEDWSYPSWIDPEAAQQSMARQQQSGVWNGGKESYHHMCRFYSGTFYTLPALQPYKYYWRLEPGVRYTCAITYDPFTAMAAHNKTYGFTTALWEEPLTCPSLFRAVDAFRRAHHLPTTPSWNALLTTPSHSPIPSPWHWYPLRRLRAALHTPHHGASGDRWNLCHYWSNFEIADLDFFRGGAYQALFRHLDAHGGFYHERWGDAPVHSLAVHLLLPAARRHHFADFGYHHEPFFQCPGNAAGGQLRGAGVFDDDGNGNGEGWSEERAGAIGCRCRCLDRRKRNNRGICLEAMQAPAARTRMGLWERWRGWYPYSIGIPAEGGWG